MGLKIGIYSSAGEITCQKYPASLGHEEIDVKTWSEMGIDCKFAKHPSTNPVFGFGRLILMRRSKIRQLRRSNRPAG